MEHFTLALNLWVHPRSHPDSWSQTLSFDQKTRRQPAGWKGAPLEIGGVAPSPWRCSEQSRCCSTQRRAGWGGSGVSDAPWQPPWRGASGMSHREETPAKNQDILEWLHHSAVLGMLWNHPEGTGEIVQAEGSLGENDRTDGWMDNYRDASLTAVMFLVFVFENIQKQIPKAMIGWFLLLPSILFFISHNTK